jgi:hypothetical protein
MAELGRGVEGKDARFTYRLMRTEKDGPRETTLVLQR